jgi:UDP-glucose:(heptosyl)LPS alpha-1,3-glucosyltransferase
MKLALIRRQFSATGGAELYVQRLLAALVKAGHEPHLFAESWEGAPEGVALQRVPVSGSRAENPVRFAHAVKEAVAREKFDCVFSLERTVKQDVYRAGDGVHRVWLQRRREFAPWWKRPFIGRGAFHRNMMALEAQTFDPANTRRIIVNSDMVRREILEHFQFPEERIHLVRNGVNVARFQSGKRAETRARFGVKDDEILLLFVGSGWERKGYIFLHRMMHLSLSLRQRYERRSAEGKSVNVAMNQFHRRLKLLVVGKDRPPKSAPPNIIFAGSLPDVENAYAAADAFVFLPIYEPSSNVVVEALAAGLPVITTPQNGASELIEFERNGYILECAKRKTLSSEALLVAEIWSEDGPRRPVPCSHPLSIEENVRSTLAVLELAARERSA